MPIMQWDETLDIGVAAMNDDHQEILEAMNAIFDAHEAGRAGTPINELVAKLGAVCVSHFRDEEAFMERIGFPGIVTHRLIHKQLLDEYGKHADAIRTTGGKANADFFMFLKRWLTAHIKGIDAKYGARAKSGKAA